MKSVISPFVRMAAEEDRHLQAYFSTWRGQVVWLELFHRHDKDAKFNALVRAVNKRIHKKLTRSKEDEKRIAVIQTSGLKRDDFNKGGLHLINQRKQSIFSTSINVFMFRNKISVHFFPSLKFIYRHRPLHSC